MKRNKPRQAVMGLIALACLCAAAVLIYQHYVAVSSPTSLPPESTELASEMSPWPSLLIRNPDSSSHERDEAQPSDHGGEPQAESESKPERESQTEPEPKPIKPHEAMDLIQSGDRAALVQRLEESGGQLDLSSHSYHAIAIEAGHAELIPMLEQYGAEPTARFYGDWTPLMSAAITGDLELVDRFLERGLNPMQENRNRETAYTLAVKHGQDEVARRLEPLAGPEVDGRELIRAVAQRRRSRVRQLLDAGAPVNGRDELGRTALFYALSHLEAPGEFRVIFRKRQHDVISLLLDRGADAAVRDSEGKTPLMAYLQGDSYYDTRYTGQWVSRLLREGADISAVDNDGKSVFDRIAELEPKGLRESIVRQIRVFERSKELGHYPDLAAIE